MLFDDFATELLHTRDSQPDEQAVAFVALLRQLDSTEVAAAVHFLQGRFDQGYRPRLDGDRSRFPRLSSQVRVASARYSHGRGLPAGQLTLADVYRALHDLWPRIETWLSGKAAVPDDFMPLAQQLSQSAQSILVRALVAPVLSDELLIKVVANLDPRASTVMTSRLRESYLHTLPDLGRLAAEVLSRGIQIVRDVSPEPAIPVPPESLRVWSSVEEAWSFKGPCLVQPKFDGMFVQMHKYEGRVCVFVRGHRRSRWLPLTEQLSELSQIWSVRTPAETVIIEGELVGYRVMDEEVTSYQDTLTAPFHRLFAHELLFLNGTDYRAETYVRRRATLSALVGQVADPSLMLMPESPIETEADMRRFFEDTISDPRYEGVITKYRFAPYMSGRLSAGKGKLKRYESFDAVVVGYRESAGEVTGVLVAIWDGTPGLGDRKLVPVALVESVKAGRDQWHFIESSARANARSFRHPLLVPGGPSAKWTEPLLVVEVGCDGQRVRDPIFEHLGYTFRDRTFLRLRENDKSIWDADNVERFRGLRLAPGES